MLKKFFTHDFRHTVINQLWKLISGPALLILIPIYLNVEAQGFWFTFLSLGALAVFADLGFTAIILQFSAHEFAHLHFDENKKITGNEYHLKRISSLFRYALHWGFKISIIAFPLIVLVGYIILSQKEVTIQWAMPWIIYSIGSVLIFINNIVLSFIEGCNSVGDVQKIRFRISVLNITLILFGLLGDFELFALAIAMLTSATIGLIIILKTYGTMLKQLYNVEVLDRHNWKKEILPLLGKYSISWASGYFIFSIFTPTAFHYYGAVEAGKVGLSIAFWIAIFSISNVWMTVILPKMNMLIAKGNYKELNLIFYRHLFLTIGTYIVGSIFIFILYYFFNENSYVINIINRFVSPLSMLIISVCWLLQILISGLAIYMRAHKEEPLVVISFLNGIYVSFTTLLLAIFLPFEYFFLGFLSSYIFVLPTVLKIFRKYKEKY